jgi:hypothetical protein
MVLAQADSFFAMGRWTAIVGFSVVVFAAVAALLIEGVGRLLDAYSIRRGGS